MAALEAEAGGFPGSAGGAGRILHLQKQELARITSLTNSALFDETINLCGGEPPDGNLTSSGEWRLGELKKELNMRLQRIGFLK